jgi:hypothetical protein
VEQRIPVIRDHRAFLSVHIERDKSSLHFTPSGA